MDGIVSEVVVGSGLEVTVREQQRRVNHEKGEGEMENKDTHATNTFFMNLSHAASCTSMRARVFFALACGARAESRVAPTGLAALALGIAVSVVFWISVAAWRRSGLSNGFDVLRLRSPEPSARRAVRDTFMSSPRLRSFVGAPPLLLPSAIL